MAMARFLTVTQDEVHKVNRNVRDELHRFFLDAIGGFDEVKFDKFQDLLNDFEHSSMAICNHNFYFDELDKYLKK